jgi:hypothetical protein
MVALLDAATRYSQELTDAKRRKEAASQRKKASMAEYIMPSQSKTTQKAKQSEKKSSNRFDDNNNVVKSNNHVDRGNRSNTKAISSRQPSKTQKAIVYSSDEETYETNPPLKITYLTNSHEVEIDSYKQLINERDKLIGELQDKLRTLELNYNSVKSSFDHLEKTMSK